MIKEYLIHSYLYYEMDQSIISDSEYDQMCRDIIKLWDKHCDPLYEDIIDFELLEAGSGFGIKYPQEIIIEAKKRLSEYKQDLKLAQKPHTYALVSGQINFLNETVGGHSCIVIKNGEFYNMTDRLKQLLLDALNKKDEPVSLEDMF